MKVENHRWDRNRASVRSPFTEKAVARNHGVHCFLFLFIPLQGHTLRTEILLTVRACQMTVCGTVRRMFALVYAQSVHFRGHLV